MVYKQVFTPSKKNHSIEMPEKFFGKRVEVIVVELDNATENTNYPLPDGKRIAASELLEHFGQAADFPTIDEIRSKAWPAKW